MIDIKVPTVGESISEVTLLKWVRNNGDYVERDEVIAELESEKATFEVNAEQAGTLKQSAQEGDTLKIGDVLASIDETAAKPQGAPAASNGTPAKKEDGRRARRSHAPKSRGGEAAPIGRRIGAPANGGRGSASRVATYGCLADRRRGRLCVGLSRESGRTIPVECSGGGEGAQRTRHAPDALGFVRADQLVLRFKPG